MAATSKKIAANAASHSQQFLKINNMKKTNSIIVSHLIRAALVVVPLLLLLILTSFALGQRSGDKTGADISQVAPSTGVPVDNGTMPAAVEAGCNYTIFKGSGSIVAGTTDTGNHTDDGTTFVICRFRSSFTIRVLRE